MNKHEVNTLDRKKQLNSLTSLDEAVDVNDLLDKADKRLYLSKKNGRNMITF